MKTLTRFGIPLFTFLLGIGAGAYGLRTYVGSLSFDGLAGAQIEAENLSAVDHAPFQAFLNTHLRTQTDDGINRFDYRSAQEDRADLDAYIAGLEDQNPAELARDERLAYWLNFYNAGMIQLVLERGDFQSVKSDLAFYFIGDHFEVDGQALSLEKIEHQIVRTQFAEPRIHYGLNCASLSCPNLQAEVFVGALLDRQLDAAARDYINHPRGIKGVEGSRLIVSEIFDWFGVDFGETDQEIVDHIALYADDALLEVLPNARRLRFQPYDWALNIIEN